MTAFAIVIIIAIEASPYQNSDDIQSLIENFLMCFFVIGSCYTLESSRIIEQGTEGLVERLGRYHRKLRPGLNFVVPFLDKVAQVISVRETFVSIKNHKAITVDCIPLKVDLIVYWRILEAELTYYAIDDAEAALLEIILSSINGKVWNSVFFNTESLDSKIAWWDEFNRFLLSSLDEATEPWGIKVTRAELQSIEYTLESLDSNTISIVFQEGVDWNVFKDSLDHVGETFNHCFENIIPVLTVESIELSEDKTFTVNLTVPENISKDKIFVAFLKHYYTYASKSPHPNEDMREERHGRTIASFEEVIEVLANASS
ncbi:SPFH domain-containing protein [Nodosilinea sp. P-1105]|uniref:SPFH domain-containing protein n=1 Tax=Nodosilinea sp. P-1105 TaxID=2546229 RepID=UPI00146A56F9